MEEQNTLIARIKSKLDRFNVLVQTVLREHKDYERLLECYAEEIYDMCKKF